MPSFFRREPVLCIAALAGALSMLAVPPSAAYLSYVDLRVLCLLFCLMAVVAGLQSCGCFALLSRRLLAGEQRLRTLCLLLILLPFFLSMLVTNDVALITFVPFAILALHTIGHEELLIRVIVLQTTAANLGSMATPVGNPQNLFLYSHFGLSAVEFFGVTLPVSLVSLAALTALTMAVTPGSIIRVSFPDETSRPAPKRLGLYAVLFLLCLLTVFRVLPYGILTPVVLAAVFFTDREVLKRVDYGLLLTFVCFFVFAGNIGRIGAVRGLLAGVMERSTLLSSVLASQVISNVPAAVLLAGFTEDWRGLLLGADIGGLGTLIASLASLISFKLYLRVPNAKPLRYLSLFTAVNLAGLLILLPLSMLLI